MQYYECVGLIPGNLAENEVQPVLEEVAGFFDAQGATIKRKELIGRRKLAYAIDNMRHAYYFLVGAEMDAAHLATLEKKLKLSGTVMRFLITKHKTKNDEEIKKEQDRLARQVSQVAQSEASEQRPARKKTSRDTESKPVETSQKEEKKPENSEPVDLDQLEKKLDEILDEEIK